MGEVAATIVENKSQGRLAFGYTHTRRTRVPTHTTKQATHTSALTGANARTDLWTRRTAEGQVDRQTIGRGRRTWVTTPENANIASRQWVISFNCMLAFFSAFSFGVGLLDEPLGLCSIDHEGAGQVGCYTCSYKLLLH